MHWVRDGDLLTEDIWDYKQAGNISEARSNAIDMLLRAIGAEELFEWLEQPVPVLIEERNGNWRVEAPKGYALKNTGTTWPITEAWPQKCFTIVKEEPP
jgi:hypothetical protein